MKIFFSVQRPAIVKHINNIYNDEELEKNSEGVYYYKTTKRIS